MIADIIYSSKEFILEIPKGVTGGLIQAVSFDGSNYSLTYSISSSGGEISYVFIM